MWLSRRHRLRKAPYSKYHSFPPTQRLKDGVCKFLRFQERSGISVDGGPNRRNTAAFFKFLRRCVDPAFSFKDVNTR